MYTDITDDLAADPWFKVVEFLQQNWAVIVENSDSALVVFYGDTCGVFDEIHFNTREEAEIALCRNGFSRYQEDIDSQEFIGLPDGSFHESQHPNGPIYSSGRYWH
jgi:hypothetical protein